MIRIVRPAGAPTVLKAAGLTRRRQHETEYLADPVSFANSKGKKFLFDRDVYAHHTVKAALLAMQHKKCAFCEAKPLHVSDGDVEHYRPKAAVRQSEKAPLQRPGYYWLAYEWSNLLFACERCNRRHKKNQFPLADAGKRASDHRGDIAKEQPIFIDPVEEDPESFIAFRAHVPHPVSRSPRGSETIKALGLRRRPLRDDRFDHLERLWAVFVVASSPQLPSQVQQHARDLLSRMTAVQAEYSVMSRTAVRTWQSSAAPIPPQRR